MNKRGPILGQPAETLPLPVMPWDAQKCFFARTICETNATHPLHHFFGECCVGIFVWAENEFLAIQTVFAFLDAAGFVRPEPELLQTELLDRETIEQLPADQRSQVDYARWAKAALMVTAIVPDDSP
jgi:hypothetical protein